MQTTLESTHVLANRTHTKESYMAGILTGQVAGLIMAVVVMLVFTLFMGTTPLYPVQVIGSAALGESALVGTNWTAVLLGLIFHQLGPSLLWGVLFGFLATKFDITTYKESLIAGLAVGVIAMLGPYVLMPLLFNTMHGVDIWNREVPTYWDWAAHLVFGASFVIYPKILKKF